MPSLFETAILDALRLRIGERLRAVEYGDDCDEELVASYRLDDPDLALDGGVLLRFEGGDLIVTAKGKNDWVISTTGSSAFPDSLESFDARDLPYWRSFVGQTLVSASVLGEELEPTVIRLNFSTGSVLVWVAGGEGSIYVSWPDSKSYLSDLETLWTSASPDVIRGSISPVFTGPLPDDEVELQYREYPLAVLLTGFLVCSVVLGIVPALNLWLGLPIAAVVFALSGVGYRIGEGFFVHLLRGLLTVFSIVSAIALIRAHWFC